MIQDVASKYKFSNVLVADTRLLVPMDSSSSSSSESSGSRQPDVLVLNSRLNKCQAHQINCASCCLHIEQPEFRRRSSFDDSDSECFADCSKRRSVNVELAARAQLSGKLVILALSRINQLLDETQVDTGGVDRTSFKCQTRSTWLFQRFHPFRTGQSMNDDPKMAYYSRFQPGQVPSLLIDTMDFSWNTTLNKELISLTLRSNLNNNTRSSSINHHRRGIHSQQVVMNETLLISEMDCFESSSSSSLTGENKLSGSGTLDDGGLHLPDDLERQSLASQPSKVHLLTLINRESSNAASAAPERGSLSTNLPSNKRTRLTQVQDTRPESSFNYPGAATTRIVTSGSIAMPASQQSRARFTSSTGAYHSYNKITSSSSTTTTTRRPNTPNPPTMDGSDSLLQMNVPLLHKKYEFKINDSSRMGPAYLSESDLIGRAKLSSKGFLVLTVSSGLVILTYTLCLLVYLRWRHRSRARSRAGDTAGPHPDGPFSGKKAKDAVVPIQRVQQSMDISQPYNLQMPPATRTRLKMMLRGGIIGGARGGLGMKPEVERPMNEVDPSAVAELRRAERRRKHSHMLLMSGSTSGGGGGGGSEEFDPNLPAANPQIGRNNRSNKITLSQVDSQGQYSARYKSQRHFGSINVVRAIRQAATLARSRLHLHSRYRPNLNVIPESDLECLQSPAGRGDTYRGLFEQNNLVYISPPRSSRPEAQFDSLVQDAMRTDCSHYVDRLTSQRQANATLFSKPIPDDSPTKNPSDPVSRSKILRQVKQEDMIEN